MIRKSQARHPANATQNRQASTRHAPSDTKLTANEFNAIKKLQDTSQTLDDISATRIAEQIRTLPLEQLNALQTILETGSFDAAADELHISQSAISQRIKNLESQLGHIVLQRSKPVKPTQVGQLLVRLARQIELAQDEAISMLKSERTASAVNIRIVVNADALESWVLPALAPVVHQSISIDIRRQDEHVSAGLLRSGEVMAAITAEGRAVQGCSITKLGSMPYYAVSTAEFAERWFPSGMTLDAVEHAPLIQYDREDRMQYLFIRRITRIKVHPPTHYIPTSVGYNNAISLGYGWGLIPKAFLDTYPKDGLALLSPEPLLLPLFWQQWKLSSPALDAVAEAIISAGRRVLV
ncbi:ArgP/LysG family DNA-binding transcriptional regulator [Bifidobacterium sp.]|uniref:ArgP/LysG family DNA-binding transcriptional regulator n=1 Tax=Bifidobacterium sp. TaxID=41200 RepID=UPI0039EA6DE5